MCLYNSPCETSPWNEQTGTKSSEARNQFKARCIKLENDSNKFIKGTDITYKCLWVNTIGLFIQDIKYKNCMEIDTYQY